MIQYVEILQESRGFEFSINSVEWKLSLQYKVPDEAPNFNIGDQTGITDEMTEILEEDEDVKATELAFLLLPPGRWVPDSNGFPVYVSLQSVSIKQRDNYGWWIADATYLFDLKTGAGSNNPDQDEDADTLPFVRINFAVGNTTKTITQSLEVVSKVGQDSGPSRPLPETGLAIGVSESGITGAEIYDSGLTLQVTAYYFPSKINTSFISKLKKAAGKLNNADFLGQETREVLFLGCDGGGQVNEIIPITFTFDVKEHVYDEPDPPFPNLTMDGHDILDYRYEKKNDTDGSKLNLQFPFARFVHRVYKTTDFGVFGFPQ